MPCAAQPGAGRPDLARLPRDVEAAFGRELVAALRHEAAIRRHGARCDLDHRIRHCHLEIDPRLDRLREHLKIAVLDVAAVFAQVNRDAVGAGLLCEQRGRHRIGVASAARLAHGRDVIDVDAEVNGSKAHLRYLDSPRLTMSCSTRRLCNGRSPR